MILIVTENEIVCDKYDIEIKLSGFSNIYQQYIINIKGLGYDILRLPISEKIVNEFKEFYKYTGKPCDFMTEIMLRRFIEKAVKDGTMNLYKYISFALFFDRYNISGELTPLGFFINFTPIDSKSRTYYTYNLTIPRLEVHGTVFIPFNFQGWRDRYYNLLVRITGSMKNYESGIYFTCSRNFLEWRYKEGGVFNKAKSELCNEIVNAVTIPKPVDIYG
ncbi:hypothetical protein AFV9_gp39 [Betalipothrixvirus uzonense]|uniref:Uncharacterized protein n=1 Tax=Betalipothrixvirus uzonense TaxID=512792 RepID=B2CRL6_9VIRU|nr:hypothetical protein AFV9_gp39 [Acidianus filamentous virus 9]ACB37273.1 hypothetical protein [Acidianus filamentous virus 9]